MAHVSAVFTCPICDRGVTFPGPCYIFDAKGIHHVIHIGCMPSFVNRAKNMDLKCYVCGGKAECFNTGSCAYCFGIHFTHFGQVVHMAMCSPKCRAIQNKESDAIAKDCDDQLYNICGSCKTKEPAPSTYKKCSKCKIAYYCSRECQAADWPTHKQYCK
jgi:hypothetical protein